MKNINYIVNGVLVIAVIVLFVLQFSGKKGGKEEQVVLMGDSATVVLPVAYINTDSLLQKYKYAIELNETRMSKMEGIKATLNQKEQQLTAEFLEFQRKVENNAFLTRERAQQEQERLARKQHELETYAGRTQEEFARETMKVNQQLSDTIISLLKEFNTPKKYQIIFSNSGVDNILYADDVYNVTVEVTEYLNSRFTSSPK